MNGRVTGLVLCGGKGTRLGPLAASTPKPLLDVGGEPIAAHILRNLAAAGVARVFVNRHHEAACFAPVLGDGSAYGVAITWVDEPVLRGTAGTARAVRAEVGEALLVHYGDVLTDHDLGALLARHRECGAACTILVHQRAHSNSVALLDEHDRVVALHERPAGPIDAGPYAPWVFSGVALVSRAVLDAIPPGDVVDLPRDVLPGLARAGRLFAHRLTGHRVAVDSPARLQEAREAFERGAFTFARPSAAPRRFA